MDNIIITNASPLIFLARSQQLHLLQAFTQEVWVSQAVAEEIFVRGKDDLTSIAIEENAWLQVKANINIPQSIVEWRLGPGESSVLALSLAHDHTTVIIDDLAARRCAESLSIPLRGTLGIVLLAKQRGIIPKARPVLESMIATGLYLSPALLNRVLARVDE